MNIIGSALHWFLLLILLVFVTLEAYTRESWQQEMIDGYTYNLRETARIKAVQEAQDYSMPLVRTVEDLVQENKALREMLVIEWKKNNPDNKCLNELREKYPTLRDKEY